MKWRWMIIKRNLIYGNLKARDIKIYSLNTYREYYKDIYNEENIIYFKMADLKKVRVYCLLKSNKGQKYVKLNEKIKCEEIKDIENYEIESFNEFKDKEENKKLTDDELLDIYFEMIENYYIQFYEYLRKNNIKM